MFVDAGFSVRERLHLLALDLDTAPAPAAAAAGEGDPARPRRRARARRRCRSTSSGGSARSGSRTRSTRRPRSRFRVGRDDDRVVAYAITGVAGRYGYLQRIAVHPDARVARLGPRPRRRRPAAGSGSTGGDRVVREHAAGERTRARAVPLVRLRHPPRGPVRPRAVAVIRRASGRRSRLAGAWCSLAVARSSPASAPSGGARRPRRPSFALAGQSAWVAPDGDVPHALPARERAAPGPQVVLTVHDPLQSRTAFDESVSGGSLPPSRDLTPFAFDALPTDAAGEQSCVYPTAGITEQRRVPARGRPAQRERRVARPLRHPRGRRARSAPTARSPSARRCRSRGCGRCAPIPPTSAATVPVNPTTLADLAARRAPRAPGHAARGRTPTSRSRSRPSPETLEAWNALAARRHPSWPRARPRSGPPGPSGRHQVLTGPFVPLDLPVDPARAASAAS